MSHFALHVCCNYAVCMQYGVCVCGCKSASRKRSMCVSLCMLYDVT